MNNGTEETIKIFENLINDLKKDNREIQYIFASASVDSAAGCENVTHSISAGKIMSLGLAESLAIQIKNR